MHVLHAEALNKAREIDGLGKDGQSLGELHWVFPGARGQLAEEPEVNAGRATEKKEVGCPQFTGEEPWSVVDEIGEAPALWVNEVLGAWPQKRQELDSHPQLLELENFSQKKGFTGGRKGDERVGDDRRVPFRDRHKTTLHHFLPALSFLTKSSGI